VKSFGRLAAACTASAVLVLGSACGGEAPRAAARAVPNPTPAPNQFKWVSVDLPGQYSYMRSAVYDNARDCIWVVSRENGGYASDPMVATLTRINVADRSTVKMPLRLNADDYDEGLIALDAQDIVWMAWGETLTRFDPGTGATKQWPLPPYSGLARVYSNDGRIDAMTISSDGEIWVAAGMLSAVFGFNPRRGTWDRPINLPFVSVESRTLLAAPAPGIITINGIALHGGAIDPQDSPRFAVIRTDTRSVKILSLPVDRYVATQSGQIVYFDGAGNLVRYDVVHPTSTVIGPAPLHWGGIPIMAVDLEGNVWLGATIHGFAGVSKLDPLTGAVAQFQFPVVLRGYMPTPSPNPCSFRCYPIVCKPIVDLHCIPVVESVSPDIQGMAPDAHGNLWMVTSSSSLSNSGDRFAFGPVVELQLS